MSDRQTPREQALSSTAAGLRAAFEDTGGMTIGIEEELMLLDPQDLGLKSCAEELLARLGPDPRFRRELPAAQIEIGTPPARDVHELGMELREARRTLHAAAAGLAVPAAAGAHPSSPGRGQLNHHPAYAHTLSEYAPVAPRQLVFALQVHVAVGGADRSLAVYNSARDYLPLLAAMAAAAPFYEGRDTGLASVRPMLCRLLPRQGMPPPLPTWESYAAALRWGAEAGFLAGKGSWWWELRLHPRHGTLEFRVPDAQRTVEDVLAVVAVVQALVAWLAERYDEGERQLPTETWRIEENRWSACRHGVEGRMVDLVTGEATETRSELFRLLERVTPHARRLGAERHLARARELVERNAAIDQREVATEGIDRLLPWLRDGFLAPGAG